MPKESHEGPPLQSAAILACEAAVDVAADDISSGSWQACGMRAVVGLLQGIRALGILGALLYLQAAHTLLRDTCASHSGDIEGWALRRHSHAAATTRLDRY